MTLNAVTPNSRRHSNKTPNWKAYLLHTWGASVLQANACLLWGPHHVSSTCRGCSLPGGGLHIWFVYDPSNSPILCSPLWCKGPRNGNCLLCRICCRVDDDNASVRNLMRSSKWQRIRSHEVSLSKAWVEDARQEVGGSRCRLSGRPGLLCTTSPAAVLGVCCSGLCQGVTNLIGAFHSFGYSFFSIVLQSPRLVITVPSAQNTQWFFSSWHHLEH